MDMDLRIQKRQLILSITFSLLLLFGSLIANFYAGVYATARASNPVTDIILSNIPVFDVDWFFTYGAVLFWMFIIYLCVVSPRRIPFIAKSVSLFTIIRALFITMTHIGPFPTQVPIDATNILSKFTFGADLFFSGHTGLPFLMALIFWDYPRLRYFFIGASILFAAVVLMGHLHYTIDVFAAYFITYSIYTLAERFFQKELKLFRTGPSLPDPITK